MDRTVQASHLSRFQVPLPNPEGNLDAIAFLQKRSKPDWSTCSEVSKIVQMKYKGTACARS